MMWAMQMQKDRKNVVLGARSFQPEVDVRLPLADPTRPQPFHQNPQAVVFAGS
jgi:hypothetical protein